MGRKGFTTIEMLIVVILIGIIVMIGFPRLQSAFEKQNVRSAQAYLATMMSTARNAAIQRGCTATLNLTADSAWVTACGVNPPAANVQVGSKKLIGSDFKVTLNPSVASVAYNPRGVTTIAQVVTVRVVGPHFTDSITINQLGKVVRQ